ncbi:MAG: hypothetical protein JWO08_4276 [Verrucomicrobiaceae bacterium]|nr:hypothetical protein [Verrucomicrobiaceae bacterium]
MILTLHARSLFLGFLFFCAPAAQALTAVWNQSTDIPVTDTSYAATGDITFTLNHAPATGTDLMVVKNTGLDFINGTFNNLTQGQAVTLSFGGKDYPFVANYYGGTGNDLVLVWGLSKLMAWGHNGQHQLGAEVLNFQDSTVPVAVSPLGDLAGKFVTAVAVGRVHSLALSADGKVFSWGRNDSGSLGVNGIAGSDTPVAVGQGSTMVGKTVVAIAAGAEYSMALTSEGKVYRWGGVESYAIKMPAELALNSPGVLQGKKVVKIFQGGFRAALCSDGVLAAWGNNEYGQLGNNSTVTTAAPVAVDRSGVLAGKTVVDVAVGGLHMLILCSDGKVYACGQGEMLGNGGTTSSPVPVAVSTAGVLAGKTVTAITTSGTHNLVLCSDGSLVTWGDNSGRQLGKSGVDQALLPIAVAMTGPLAGKTPVAISSSVYSSHVRCSDGTMVSWGVGPLGGPYSFFVYGPNEHNIQNPTALQTPALVPGEKLIRVGTDGSSGHALGIVSKPLPSGLAGPTVVVEDAEGKKLTDGTGTVAMGGVGPLRNTQRAFTLKNTGTLPLSNIVISIDGVNKSAFSLTTAPATTVLGGASTSFVVTAKRTAFGPLSANLHIASNDTEGGVFDIALTAIGANGSFAFEKAVVVADADLDVVDVPIVRTGDASGWATVLVKSTVGTATDADFDPVNERVVFDSQTVKTTVRVKLTPNAHARPDEAFTLTLSDPEYGGLGVLTTTTVKIVNVTDSIKPTVTITTAGALIRTGPSVLLTGVAKDNHGLRKILLSLNGEAFNDDIFSDMGLFIPTGTTVQNYSTNQLHPSPGLNTIAVKAVDLYGNESVVSRTFQYHPLAPLSYGASGGGRVVLPIPAGQFREGVSYTVTAVPDKGCVFSRWVITNATGTGITPAMLEVPKLTFIHLKNRTLTALFIANPFKPDIVGIYNGLVRLKLNLAGTPPGQEPPPPAPVPGNDNTGCLTATVMSNGSVTGTLKMDGLSMPFSGVFDNQGVARFGPTRATTIALARNTKPLPKSPLELSLHVDMTGADRVMTGSAVQRLRGAVVAESVIQAERAAYSLAHKVPTGPDITSKPYTLVFKHHSTQPGLVAADYPQGDGYATGTVKPDGTVTFTGKLADNTAFTTSAKLSKDNRWPLYVPLYAAFQGCIAADMKVDTVPQNSDMQGSEVRWFRPYQIGVQWYPWGWAEGIAVDVMGSRYHVSIPGLNPVNAVDGNVGLNFSADEFTSVFYKDINLSPAYVASKVPVSDTSFTLALNAATGLINGTFALDDHTKPTWQGVIFEKGAESERGYGFFMTSQPRKVDGLGRSGRVILMVKQAAE